MTRKPILYVAAAVVAALLLWAILAVGARLQAPPALSGDYHVNWEWEIIPPRGQKLPDVVHVEQSGMFVTVSAEDQTLSRGRLERIDRPGQAPTYAYRRDSDRWPLDIRDAEPNRLRLTLANRTGIASREKRPTRQTRPAPATYPSTSPKPAATVAAAPGAAAGTDPATDPIQTADSLSPTASEQPAEQP